MSLQRDLEAGLEMQQNRSNGEMMETNPRHEQEPELEEALRNFRLSVHAWSDAAYSRPRTAVVPTRASVWRAASGWALGCVLVAGIATGGFYQHQRDVEHQRQAAAERQREDQLLAAHRNEDSDTLLSHVNSDVARQVPTAMDPLAGLVGEE